MAESEVAKLRERIDLEREALRNAMYGLVQTGGHDFINKRYQAIDEHYETIAALVGDKEACDIYVDEYANVIEQQQKRGVRIRLIYRYGSVLGNTGEHAGGGISESL